jgi:hypothetical protein
MKNYATGPQRSSAEPDICERFRREREERHARYLHWRELGSDLLEDAWVSVCPHAESHDVEPRMLTEVVEDIRTGGPIWVKTKWAEKQVRLDDNQDNVRRLFRLGCEEAFALNRPRISRLLKTLGLEADPATVEVQTEQPKGNTKLFYVSALVVAGVSHPIRERIVYHLPHVLGKARANDAKKWTPGVTLAGLFLGQRNKNFLAQATGLYPLDLDGIENLADVKANISQDKNVPIVFNSITGTGLRACVWGPVARDAEEYERFYRSIAERVCRTWGLEAKLDEATYDCSRLCFLPYDPEITFNC